MKPPPLVMTRPASTSALPPSPSIMMGETSSDLPPITRSVKDSQIQDGASDGEDDRLDMVYYSAEAVAIAKGMASNNAIVFIY